MDMTLNGITISERPRELLHICAREKWAGQSAHFELVIWESEPVLLFTTKRKLKKPPARLRAKLSNLLLKAVDFKCDR